MLEKLLMKALKLETRKDPNNGKERELDLNIECDLAYIRCQFKRMLAKNKINMIRAYYTWDNAYCITKESFINGWDKLEGRENVIESLLLAITEAEREGQPVFAIKFE